jgi:hypothetical protein
MVSGHYVAPSWSQGLARNVVQPLQANYAAQQAAGMADQQSAALNNQINTARSNWQGSLPQTIAGRPELQGPQAEGGSPELDAVPNQIPDRGTVLRKTLEGMRIPGNEKSADLWNRGMQEEQIREDKQAETRSTLAQTMALRREQAAQLEAYKRDQMKETAKTAADKLAETVRSNQANEEIKRQLQVTNRAIQAAHDAARTSSNRLSASAEATDKRDVYRSLEKIGTRLKPLVPVVGAANEIQALIDKNTNPTTGKVADIPGMGYESLIPPLVRSVGASVGIMDPATNPNKAKVASLVGSIMRNQAGLSQTISEAARVVEQTMSSGSYSQQEFLDGWVPLVNAINKDMELVQQTERPEAIDMFKKNGGSFAPVRSSVKSKEDRLNELRVKRDAAGVR